MSISRVYMLEKKQTREMDTTLSKRDRYFVDFRHGISVFSLLFLFVCLFFTVLRFLVHPNVPPSTFSSTRGYNYRALSGKNFCVLDI